MDEREIAWFHGAFCPPVHLEKLDPECDAGRLDTQTDFAIRPKERRKEVEQQGQPEKKATSKFIICTYL